MSDININIGDKKLFGNEAGEDEIPDVLDSYFLEVEDSEDFFDHEVQLSVVSARKGMGKSSLLSYLYHTLQNKKTNGDMVIKVTGNDLLGLGDFLDKDQAYLENYWKQIICKRINLEIGKDIGFAITDNEILMVENAEIENMKELNFISSLLSRLSFKLNETELSADIKKKIPKNWENLLKTYQEKHNNKCIWLLIDDIDAKFVNNEEYQVRVSSFFTAIRSLSTNIKDLNIRATSRSDVWNSLNYVEDLDKWDQYIFEIKWTRNQMRDILAKRIEAYIKREFSNTIEAQLTYKDNYLQLFDLVFFKKINWGGKKVHFYQPLLIYANRRPRWLGQLCRLSASHAKKSIDNKISERHLISSLDKFGKNRVSDLEKEHSHQFKFIQKLIDIFRTGKRAFYKKDLHDLIKEKFIRIFEEQITTIDGEPYKDTDQIGAFLYKIGFITTRENHTYINFDDKPDLYTSHTNLDNKIMWEVHPAYRNYLAIK